MYLSGKIHHSFTFVGDSGQCWAGTVGLQSFNVSTRTNHMRKLFMAEMEAVGDQLLEMAILVNRAMKQARVALETQDLRLAEAVITQDARIDYLQNALDERSIELLLLQSPVATD